MQIGLRLFIEFEISVLHLINDILKAEHIGISTGYTVLVTLAS